MSRHLELVQAIQEVIETQGLAPGDKLPSERKLAAACNASRNSVREAIRVLTQQGILETRRGDGTYLSAKDQGLQGSLEQALSRKQRRDREVFALRRLLEPGVAALAAENATARDIRRLKALVYDQRRKQEANEDDTPLDTAFHLQLGYCTKNSVLVEVLLALHKVLEESRSCDLQNPLRRSMSPHAHNAIIDAIEARDAVEARRAMEQHLQEAEELAFPGVSESGASQIAPALPYKP